MAKWQVRKQISDDLEIQLLAARGIKDKNKFFHPDYEKDLGDPFGLLDMDKAVARILSAIQKNEKILLFADYDADGICSAAIFHDFFKKIGFENFSVYIPDRSIEGYGLNLEAIEQFEKERINLIITLDCGITNYEETDAANKKGMDVVILDHHLEVEKLPKAIAVVDPKREEDNYFFKMLVDAGVAFKTVQALFQKGDFDINPSWIKWLLDLVAIATVADMHPLVGENRVLVFYGLCVLRKTQRPGLLKLFEKIKVEKENISEDDIAFLIAPRINIASRMDHANISFALLTTQSETEAEWLAGRLDELNTERKKIAEEIFNQIDKKVEEYKSKPEIIIEGDPSWNVGILSLVANKVVDKYKCPVFLWGFGGIGNIKGSCRSNGIVNLVDLMEKIPKGFLGGFGGHPFAGGFFIEEGKISKLKEEIIKAFDKIPKKESEDILWIDKEIKIEDVSWEFWEIIKKFGPFGIDNPKPLFLLRNLEVFRTNKFGNGGIHLRLDFKGRDGIISAIGFFMSPVRGGGSNYGMSNGDWDIKEGDKIDMVASVEENKFNGRSELRLRIVDLKLRY